MLDTILDFVLRFSNLLSLAVGWLLTANNLRVANAGRKFFLRAKAWVEERT